MTLCITLSYYLQRLYLIHYLQWLYHESTSQASKAVLVTQQSWHHKEEVWVLGGLSAGRQRLEEGRDQDPRTLGQNHQETSATSSAPLPHKIPDLKKSNHLVQTNTVFLLLKHLQPPSPHFCGCCLFNGVHDSKVVQTLMLVRELTPSATEYQIVLFYLLQLLLISGEDSDKPL